MHMSTTTYGPESGFGLGARVMASWVKLKRGPKHRDHFPVFCTPSIIVWTTTYEKFLPLKGCDELGNGWEKLLESSRGPPTSALHSFFGGTSAYLSLRSHGRRYHVHDVTSNLTYNYSPTTWISAFFHFLFRMQTQEQDRG